MAESENLTWLPSSPSKLEEAERRVFATLNTPYKAWFVNIGPAVGEEDCLIRTLVMNENSPKIPLVMVHGLGAGIGFWSLNLDCLAASGRPVYAIDNLGFARSSRPVFSKDPVETEKQFVTVLEEWRKKLDLQKFILLGHSLGGYIGTSYTLVYPHRIAHLILVDPWGFTKRPQYNQTKYPVPHWIIVLAFFTRPFNPFWAVRTLGPLGPVLMKIIQSHLVPKFDAVLNDEETGQNARFGDYAYHCNVRAPSGENAFHTMSDFVWAKIPMLKRIPHLDSDVDLTTVYGGKSFIWRFPVEKFQKLRKGPTGYTDVQVLEGAGHDVHLDSREEFHRIVLNACKIADDKFKA